MPQPLWEANSHKVGVTVAAAVGTVVGTGDSVDVALVLRVSDLSTTHWAADTEFAGTVLRRAIGRNTVPILVLQILMRSTRLLWLMYPCTV
jgi:hypothetical protein